MVSTVSTNATSRIKHSLSTECLVEGRVLNCCEFYVIFVQIVHSFMF